MKILNILILSVALVLANGCSTFGGGKANDAAQQLASMARVAAFVGASTYLQSHPEQRPAFEMARTAADSLLQSDSIDPLALREALAMLPVDELRGERSAIWCGAAQLLFENANGQTAPVQTPAQVKAFAAAIRDGLGLALGGTASSAP